MINWLGIMRTSCPAQETRLLMAPHHEPSWAKQSMAPGVSWETHDLAEAWSWSLSAAAGIAEEDGYCGAPITANIVATSSYKYKYK